MGKEESDVSKCHIVLVNRFCFLMATIAPLTRINSGRRGQGRALETSL